MPDELLPYYNKELAFIRQLGVEFAKEQPKIAGRLGINNAETIEDPHVSRLIQSYAYLNARIQHKLNDEFPELSDSLLNVLFPHYQRPIPSMTIIQYEADKSQLDASQLIPDDTVLDTEPFKEGPSKGERCTFTSTYPVELLPITVSSAKVIGRPFVTPGTSENKGAQSVLQISLTTFTDDITFAELRPEKFRFYLEGQPHHINPLYELLLNNCLNVVLARSENDTSPIYLGKDCIKAVGFNENEGLLPYPTASFPGYRLLTEYFIFPEKFMFVDFTGLANKIPENIGNKLDLYIYFGSSNTADITELERHISEDTFKLGCSPAINLFSKIAEPISLDHTCHEYQIIPEVRSPINYEVYSVDKVIAGISAEQKEEYHPIYGLTHEHQESNSHAFWFASRRHAKLGDDQRDEATDVFISLVDLDFNPNVQDGFTLNIHTTCSNRNQAAKLPYGNRQPQLHCDDAAPSTSSIHCIKKPTVTVQPKLKSHARWELLSHLNLNHLSLTGRDNATEALQEILRLYEFKDSSANRGLIKSIVDVKARPISAPLNIDGRATLCRGIEVEITLDELLLTGSSGFLFATVLEHFFGLYCSINSFTRVLVKLKDKEGYLKKCPPRAGQKILL